MSSKFKIIYTKVKEKDKKFIKNSLSLFHEIGFVGVVNHGIPQIAES